MRASLALIALLGTSAALSGCGGGSGSESTLSGTAVTPAPSAISLAQPSTDTLQRAAESLEKARLALDKAPTNAANRETLAGIQAAQQALVEVATLQDVAVSQLLELANTGARFASERKELSEEAQRLAQQKAEVEKRETWLTYGLIAAIVALLGQVIASASQWVTGRSDRRLKELQALQLQRELSAPRRVSRTRRGTPS